MTVPTPVPITNDGDGYTTRNGIRVTALPLIMIASQALALGQTIGPVIELGRHRTLSLLAQTTAKSGTSPTLDLAVETSHDGATDWQSVGSFNQQSDVGLAMGAVASTGTTPPVVTLSGTALVPVNFRMECTTLGARATAVVRYSVDGGVSWVSSVATAATIAVLDSNGVATGLTINYANTAAAVDNVWTAKTAGYERKRFSGLGRFARVVAQVGGSSTPIMTSSVTGEAV